MKSSIESEYGRGSHLTFKLEFFEYQCLWYVILIIIGHLGILDYFKVDNVNIIIRVL
jgi:hypothetical protein